MEMDRKDPKAEGRLNLVFSILCIGKRRLKKNLNIIISSFLWVFILTASPDYFDYSGKKKKSRCLFCVFSVFCIAQFSSLVVQRNGNWISEFSLRLFRMYQLFAIHSFQHPWVRTPNVPSEAASSASLKLQAVSHRWKQHG